MKGNKEGVFEVEFRPLQPILDVREAMLSFDIAELGTYKYALKLLATPPPSTPQLRFEAPLGGQQVETFTFRAFNTAATTFNLKVTHPDFFEIVGGPQLAVEAAPTWEGVDVRVQIRFEPEGLGQLSDTLVIDGGDAGEYKCTLLGVCKRPQPQGPFVVTKAGRDIAFRNVFSDEREFSFTVDSDKFTVAAPTMKIPGRQSSNCNVKFTPPADGAANEEISAKLFVKSATDNMPPWVYYLRSGGD
jgi:hypothetical protein